MFGIILDIDFTFIVLISTYYTAEVVNLDRFGFRCTLLLVEDLGQAYRVAISVLLECLLVDGGSIDEAASNLWLLLFLVNLLDNILLLRHTEATCKCRLSRDLGGRESGCRMVLFRCLDL